MAFQTRPSESADLGVGLLQSLQKAVTLFEKTSVVIQSCEPVLRDAIVADVNGVLERTIDRAVVRDIRLQSRAQRIRRTGTRRPLKIDERAGIRNLDGDGNSAGRRIGAGPFLSTRPNDNGKHQNAGAKGRRVRRAGPSRTLPRGR